MVVMLLGFIAFVLILVVTYIKDKECRRSNLASMVTFACLLWSANAIYTGFLNIDGPSADRRHAIAVAVCDPPKNVPSAPQDLRCGSTATAYGYDIQITSARVLEQSEIDLMTERVRVLKPLITEQRIHLEFQQEKSSELEDEKNKAKTTYYSHDTYRSVDL